MASVKHHKAQQQGQQGTGVGWVAGGSRYIGVALLCTEAHSVLHYRPAEAAAQEPQGGREPMHALPAPSDQ